MEDPGAVQLILAECTADFGDIKFSFGGDDFILTVRAEITERRLQGG